ncbi:MAG: DegT/DnrJ/EryC1/StrS family aminotransferase [Limnohabitans sp.]|uniref:DegT/DnrJ/EryC1/StrS family aminotransferase n=1 Tax=Limnohabitans sp. TaxID=1907725 RepID=UPI00391BCAF4
MKEKFIPVNQPLLDSREKELLLECIETGWISSEGPFVGAFEDAFSRRVHREHGIAVANGSAALDIAVAALKIGSGDEVIMPTHTIISCASAVVRAGAVPVLVDSDPETWNMDVAQIEEKITNRTVAIMVVHIFGLPVDMDPVLEIARRRGLHVIEDAAQMIGQNYRGVPCGSFGTISTFSFYPNKHITTGEGGMVLTNDATLAERCRSLRNLCFKPERRFVHDELGWNYRMTNIQAALGIAQLERLDQFVKMKRSMGCKYRELLSGVPNIQLPLEKTDYAENIYWVFGVILSDEIPFTSDEAIRRLAQMGVGTRPFFWPMHEQPVFNRMGRYVEETYPFAERMGRRGFYLPSGLAVTTDQQEQVAAALREVLSDPQIL